MTDENTDLDALVQETIAITKRIRVEPPISERDEVRQRVPNFKARQERLVRDFAATQSIFNIVKAPLGWLIYSDGVKVGGVCGSKEAAFEAATVAATFSVRDGEAFKSTSQAHPRRTRYREIGFQRLNKGAARRTVRLKWRKFRPE